MDFIADLHSTVEGLTPPSSVQNKAAPLQMVLPQTKIEITSDNPFRSLWTDTLSRGIRLSVVVPVYNERLTLLEIIRRIREVPLDKEIILVDDASTDGTSELLMEMEPADDLRIVFHNRNRGKGAALQTGFAHAAGDIVIIQDADLEYDPGQYDRLIQPILDDVADVVYGSRFLSNGTHRVLHFRHSMGNRLLTMISNFFTDLNLTDMETCYKVFRRDVIADILPKLKEKRFGIDPELTAQIARHKYRIYEVGISYFGRTYKEGKKIGLRDACRVLWTILKCWWKS